MALKVLVLGMVGIALLLGSCVQVMVRKETLRNAVVTRDFGQGR